MADSLTADMRRTLEGIEVGMSVRSAAMRARVSSRRVEAWLSLAAEGVEPFAAWYEAADVSAAEARYQILQALRELARVDARASSELLNLWGQDAMPPLPAPRSSPSRHRQTELELARRACGESEPITGVRPVARFEPRRGRP